MKIMFICTGNICRSAMAHAMLNKIVQEEKMNIQVYSCGVYAQDGDIPTDEAIITMKKYNIDLTNHRATNIRKSQIENMDIILCATRAHKNMVISMYPNLKDKIFTMKEYVGVKNNDFDIKDPWGYGIIVYESCAAEIKDCIDKIIKEENIKRKSDYPKQGHT